VGTDTQSRVSSYESKEDPVTASGVFVNVSYDTVNDKTEEMLDAARALLKAEAEIAVARQELGKALAERKLFVEGVLFQLENGRNAIPLDVI